MTSPDSGLDGYDVYGGRGVMIGKLIGYLVPPLAKFLLRLYTKDPVTVTASDFVDATASQINSYFATTDTDRQFTKLSEQVVRRILPLFEDSPNLDEGGLVSLGMHLAKTLEMRLTKTLLINKALDSRKVAKYLLRKSPLPTGQYNQTETELYTRSVNLAATYAVELVSALPALTGHITAECLRRIDALTRTSEEILDRVRRIQENTAGDSADADFEVAYRIATLGSQDYLELFGSGLSSESQRHSLSVAFVALNLHTTEKATTVSVDELLLSVDPTRHKLLIRGPAGSGKSTILRWLALQAAAYEQDVSGQSKILESQLTFLKTSLLRAREGDDNLSSTADFAQAAKEAGYASSNEFLTAMLGGKRAMPSDADIAEDPSILRSVLKPSGSLRTVYSEGDELCSNAIKESSNLPDHGDADYVTKRPLGRQNRGISDKRPWFSRLPFIVPLRNACDGRLPNIISFPSRCAPYLEQSPRRWLHNCLRQSRCMVLFDGLDEVPKRHRQRIIDEINTFASNYPGNLYIVTTRPEAHPLQHFTSRGFVVADINPLSQVGRSVFIERWYAAISRELNIHGKDTSSIPKMIADLERQLEGNYRVASLASNPLLCAMICALNRDLNSRLPPDHITLCGELCRTLIRRDELTGLDETFSKNAMPQIPNYWLLTDRHRMAFVETVANHMVKNELFAVPREEAIAKMTEALATFALNPSPRPEDVLDAMVERSGLFKELEHQCYGFLHNTLKEFLAARRFVLDNDYGLLARRCLEPAWTNVVVFAASTDQPRFATNLLRQILDSLPKGADLSRRCTEVSLRRTAIMAIRCRAAAMYQEDRNVDVRLQKLEDAVLPPQDMEEARLLAEVGPRLIPYLIWKPGLSDDQLTANIRTLRLIGTPECAKVLRAYIGKEGQVVEEELVHVFNPLVFEQVRRDVLSGCEVPRTYAQEITDLVPLSAMKAAKKVRRLNLSYMPITNISALSSFSNLEHLFLKATKVCNLSPLAHLKGLLWLDLEDTLVDDIDVLLGLVALEWLDLSNTKVGDVGVLTNLKSLRWLNVKGLGLPSTQIDLVRKRIPGIVVNE
jgi:hypothetical protein